MGKVATVPACAGLSITDCYKDWRPSQAWLAERVRMVATRLYAQAEARGGKKGDGSPIAVHVAAITAQVSKVFGAIYDEAAPQFSESSIVELLVRLGDLGDIGYGYYIPRESRIVRMTAGWGRLAGGLPAEFSEHPEKGIECILETTIGRIVRLRGNFSEFDQETEHSEVYESITSTDEKNLGRLWARLPDRIVTRPPDETTEYYNAGFRRGRTRRDRWHNKVPDAVFVVARTRTLPAHYYLLGANPSRPGKGWFELESEEARRWILSAERIGGVTNLLRTSESEGERTFFLPDMLPRAWTAGILSCASTVTPGEDGGWCLKVQRQAFEALEILLRSANIQLI